MILTNETRRPSAPPRTPLAERRPAVPPLAPGAVPGLGHAPALLRDPLGFLGSLAQHGAVVRIRLGPRTVCVVTDAGLVHTLLVALAHDCPRGAVQDTLKTAFGDGLLMSEGRAHRDRRRTIQPAFGADRMAEYVAVMHRVTEERTRRWRPGQVLDVAKEMNHLALEIVTRALFDARLSEDATLAFHRALPDMVKGQIVQSLYPHRAFARLPLPVNRRFDAAVRVLNQVVDQAVNGTAPGSAFDDPFGGAFGGAFEGAFGGAFEGPADTGPGGGCPVTGTGRRGTTLPALLRGAVDPATGRPLTEADVRSEAITMFGAGTETVSTTLTWLIDELVRHPGIEARVLAELDEHLPAGTVPTPEALARLGYTRAVTQEVVRLHAPNAFLMRTAQVPVELGPYRIPAGTELLYSLTAIHRDPVLYPEPLRFLPGRWHGADRARGPAGGGAARQAFLPFGAGKHKCIGEAFAWAELTVAAAAILRRWRPTAVPGSRAREVVWTTVQAQGLRVRLTPRGGRAPHAAGPRRTPSAGHDDAPAQCVPIIGPRQSDSDPRDPRDPHGPRGSRGAQPGEVCPAGAAGHPGPAASTGPTGSGGPSGSSGPTGPTGPAAAAAPVGPAGPRRSAVLPAQASLTNRRSTATEHPHTTAPRTAARTAGRTASTTGVPRTGTGTSTSRSITVDADRAVRPATYLGPLTTVVPVTTLEPLTTVRPITALPRPASPVHPEALPSAAAPPAPRRAPGVLRPQDEPRAPSELLTAAARHGDWALAHGLLAPEDLARYHTYALPELIGHSYPRARGTELDLLIDILGWFTILDDRFDGPPGRDPAEARAIVGPLLAVLAGRPVPPGTPQPHLLDAWRELWQRQTAPMPPGWRRRAAAEWHSCLETFLAETAHRAARTQPDLAETVRLRRHASCLYPFMDILEHVHGGEAPAGLHADPALHRLRANTADAATLINDLYSADREERQNVAAFNTVLTLQRIRGCTRSRAARAVGARIARLTAESETLRHSLLLRHPAGRWYLDGTRELVEGVEAWTSTSRRYTAEDAPR
ncbi:cytochrome P450 [Kitasatospora sp. NPDC056184]|uniref:cytochrome P450 n=1 Tax=Kitasatospora sp. NPDC056184 TaxID=3345738 RepID=UPI0035DD1E90